ncbi:MAG: NAD(P)/FAD-dependent oxidoreductase [Armatimonadetes bacterium]|nr:NAD(P)/FAD-dependent oxidoreductase [Armatimonadota bacterium]
MYDVAVVGAGPAGNWVSYLLSRQGFEVLVLEEHKDIGLPIHCTGVVGNDLFEEFDVPKDACLRELNRFKVFSPSLESFCIPADIQAYVIDRYAFDNLLAKKSKAAGTTYILQAKALDVTTYEDRVRIEVDCDGESRFFSAKLCVLATGSMSNLPYRHGIGMPNYFLKTAQTEADLEGLPDVEVYLGEEIAPGSFAWSVPSCHHQARIGVITKGNAKTYLERLLQSTFLRDRIKSPNYKIRCSRVPIGVPKRTMAGRVIGVGDAASQVKSTTGGGIYYGMIGAQILADTIMRSASNGDFGLSKLKSYDTLWKQRLGTELKTGVYLRHLFENVDDDYLDGIFRLMSQSNIQQIISHKGDFNKHKDLILSLARVPEIRKVVLELARRNLPFMKKRKSKVVPIRDEHFLEVS